MRHVRGVLITWRGVVTGGWTARNFSSQLATMVNTNSNSSSRRISFPLATPQKTELQKAEAVFVRSGMETVETDGWSRFRTLGFSLLSVFYASMCEFAFIIRV